MRISIRGESKGSDIEKIVVNNSEIDFIPFVTMQYLSQQQEKNLENLNEFQEKYGFTFRDYELLTNIIKEYDKNEDSSLSNLKSSINVLKNSKQEYIKEIFTRISEEKIDKKTLKDIIELFTIEDNLLDLYKFLNFIQKHSKDEKLRIIVPPVIELLTRLASINHETRNIYDPTCLDAQTITSLKDFNHADIYEKNETEYYHAIQNFILNDIPLDKISFKREKVEIDDSDKKYDTIISLPPENKIKRKIISIDKFGEYPSRNPNSIHLLNLIDHLADDGIIVTVITQDFLVSKDAYNLRKCLIERNLIDTIIEYDTELRGRDIIILILNKNKQTDDFLFIKPEHFILGLVPGSEDKIIKSYENREVIPKFSNILTKEEILSNDYNLNTKRYVYTLDYNEIPVQKILDQQNSYAENIKKLDEDIEKLLDDYLSD